MQVAVGPANKIPNSPGARGYADLDCDNPSQDVVSFFKHIGLNKTAPMGMPKRFPIQINVEYDEDIFVKPPAIENGPEAWRLKPKP